MDNAITAQDVQTIYEKVEKTKRGTFFIHKSDTLPYDIVTIKDSIESFRGKINGFWKRRKVGFKKNVLDKAFFVMYTLKVKIIETQIN